MLRLRWTHLALAQMRCWSVDLSIGQKTMMLICPTLFRSSLQICETPLRVIFFSTHEQAGTYRISRI